MSPSIFYDKGVLLMMVAELQAGNDNNDAIAAKLVVKHGKSVDDWNKGLKEYKHHIKKTCKEMAEGVSRLCLLIYTTNPHAHTAGRVDVLQENNVDQARAKRDDLSWPKASRDGARAIATREMHQ